MDIEFERGMMLVQGSNGAGKSNLMEALYLLTIAKSLRASTDREMVRRDSDGDNTYAQVAAVVQRNSEQVRLQIDLRGSITHTSHPAVENVDQTMLVQKYVRVDGAPRRASELIGEINAVMFTPNDLQLLYGGPSLRRRYIDILISQLDRGYLRAIQSYQKILQQRNHLLKSIRERKSAVSELAFWDEQISGVGKYVVHKRLYVLRSLAEHGNNAYKHLSGAIESLVIKYKPSLILDTDPSEDQICDSMMKALEQGKSNEISQGHTSTGPHRDDISVTLDGMEVGLYASRGQCRSVVMAMKLAEAGMLRNERGQDPILLLDDMLSELDQGRRNRFLQQVGEYPQCFITTADVTSIDDKFLTRMTKFKVKDGGIENQRFDNQREG